MMLMGSIDAHAHWHAGRRLHIDRSSGHLYVTSRQVSYLWLFSSFCQSNSIDVWFKSLSSRRKCVNRK